MYRNTAERILHAVVTFLVRLVYRLKLRQPLPVPAEGAAIIAPNHVTFIDGLIVAALSKRPVRFVVDADQAKRPFIRWFVKWAGAVPIASQKTQPKVFETAFQRIRDYLRAGEVVCIFPEGALTRDGEMQPFRPGIERIVRETPAPVIPVALRGLWGSTFSRRGQTLLSLLGSLFRPLWRRTVEVVWSAPVPAERVSAQALETEVRALRGVMA
jgi:1-acyl-sn-glycerol-3-phosphate acyltransferase